MKILLADDSPAMRTLYRTVLRKLGHSSGDLVEAKEGREVMAALRDPVEWIVFDWDLPGMDGLGLMLQLKKLGLAGRVSVLLSVNRQQRVMLPQAARLGPCESIDRPFTEEVLERKLTTLGLNVERLRGRETPRGLPPVPRGPESDPGAPFLNRLPPPLRDDLLKLGTDRRHAAGDVLLRAGQVCESLCIVTQGEVEILQGATGKCLRTAKEGDVFGELSYMMSEPSGTTARARTLVVTVSLSRTRISDLLRRHPGLDQHLSSLMTPHREIMTARATTIAQSDFKGTFDTMPFANLLQILSVGRKTGVLGIRDQERSGGIYLENGEAVHAWTEDLVGEPAFFALSGWTRARFAFNSMRRNEERSMKQSTISLLIEAMRRLEPSEEVGSSSGGE